MAQKGRMGAAEPVVFVDVHDLAAHSARLINQIAQ
jgi:hypothetical protein